MAGLMEVLTNAALPAAAIQSILGLLLTFIKQWTISQKDFRNRKRWLNDQMLVTTAGAHERLVRTIFERYYDMIANKQDVQSRSVPAIDIEYVQRLNIVFCNTLSLEKDYEGVKRWHGFYVLSIIAGVVLVIVSWFFVAARPYVSVFSVVLVLVLLFSLPRMRKKEANLERIENRVREQNPANAQRESID